MAAKIRRATASSSSPAGTRAAPARSSRCIPKEEPRAGARRQHGQAPPDARPRRRRRHHLARKRRSTCRTSRIADPKDGKPTRVGFKIMNDGTKVRVAKRSGEMIDG